MIKLSKVANKKYYAQGLGLTAWNRGLARQEVAVRTYHKVNLSTKEVVQSNIYTSSWCLFDP